MRLRCTSGLLLAGALLLTSGPASAQMESREAIALQNQILELRHDMQVLQSQAGRGAVAVPPQSGSYLGGAYGGRPPAGPPGGGGSDITAQLLERVQALEEQVRQLRGQVDEVTNQTQRQNADLAKQLGDLSFQLQQGGRTPSGAPPPANAPPANPARAPAGPPQATAAPAPTGPVRRTPEIALQEGYAALARRDYPASEASAREVLQGNRTSPRAYDAQYLLAQALAGQRNYAQAAIAYDDTYNRSRSGGHAPDALVGLANSLAAIGEKRAACETLTKLAAEFPHPSPAVREGAAGVRQRAACH